MKALILAAGFGTRLLPHTSIKPKPLFTLNGIPTLQICIEKLIKSGCTDIIINTHHLHHQIEQFIAQYIADNQLKLSNNSYDTDNNYAPNNRHNRLINIKTIYEPEILDTGGAIRNVRDFMGNEPFIVINSDIVSNIDLKKVWNFHISGDWCATLVLHDCPIYNKVSVNDESFIKSFGANKDFSCNIPNSCDQLFAFTGIQVLSPQIFDYIYRGDTKKAAPFRKADFSKKSFNVSKNPSNFSTEPFSSIDLYSYLAEQGNLVKAFICKDIFWQDIGTPESYRDIAIKFTACSSFGLEPLQNMKNIVIDKLKGDGSDRGWFRCKMADSEDISLIIADHGICHHNDKTEEIDSFINIGNHLFAQGLPVPKIKGYDRFAGLVVLEDLGDVHLADIINKFSTNPNYNNPNIKNNKDNRDYTEGKADIKQDVILNYYRAICSLLIDFSIKGIEGFKDEWTFQTPSYSKDMILEKECRYFVEAFLQGYLKLNVQFDDFIDAFEFIADNALDGAFYGLMHRDMQSRNIMVKDGKYFFIDFQSARRGPLQYDLASLLIDPYVNLEEDIRENILYECLKEIKQKVQKLNGKAQLLIEEESTEKFIKSYRYCALTRNMQMLGAFSNLSMNKGKTYFEQYIPVAIANLKKNINFVDRDKISSLYHYILDI
ncbi:MAG: phosphotransferase [Desulfamplus sp.]|nr:phosphotransferase [Desulfamplus sp.]